MEGSLNLKHGYLLQEIAIAASANDQLILALERLKMSEEANRIATNRVIQLETTLRNVKSSILQSHSLGGIADQLDELQVRWGEVFGLKASSTWVRCSICKCDWSNKGVLWVSLDLSLLTSLT